MWKRVSGKLKHVTVSPGSRVWGVNNEGDIYYRQGITASNKGGTGWTRVNGNLMQISAGRSGVWGVNTQNQIFYRVGTFGDNDRKGSGWQKVRNTAGNLLDGREVGIDSLDHNRHLPRGNFRRQWF